MTDIKNYRSLTTTEHRVEPSSIVNYKKKKKNNSIYNHITAHNGFYKPLGVLCYKAYSQLIAVFFHMKSALDFSRCNSSLEVLKYHIKFNVCKSQ